VAACGLPILLGFALPVLVLLRLMVQELNGTELNVPLERFAQSAWVSFKLAALAAVLATVVAATLAFTLRTRPGRPLRWAVDVVSLGYAVPGAVIAVGILLPLAGLQRWAPQWHISAIVTGTLFGVLYAYQVRFSSVALQSLEAGYARIPAAIDETARQELGEFYSKASVYGLANGIGLNQWEAPFLNESDAAEVGAPAVEATTLNENMTVALRVTIESEGKIVLFGDSFQVTASGARTLVGN